VDPNPHILVANEPSLYRHTLASELPRLALASQFSFAPTELESVVVRIRPRLVICSHLTETIRGAASTALVLYPDGKNRAIFRIDGQQQILANPSLNDLLAAVDAPTRSAYL
jgi:hypothetical protein